MAILVRIITLTMCCIFLITRVATTQTKKVDYGKAAIDGVVVEHNGIRLGPHLMVLAPSVADEEIITLKDAGGKLYSCGLSGPASVDIRPGDRVMVSGSVYREEMNPAHGKALDTDRRIKLEQAFQAMPYQIAKCKVTNHHITDQRTAATVKGEIERKVDNPPSQMVPGSFEFTIKDSEGKEYRCSVPMLPIYANYKPKDNIAVGGYVALTKGEIPNVGVCKVLSHEASSN